MLEPGPVAYTDLGLFDEINALKKPERTPTLTKGNTEERTLTSITFGAIRFAIAPYFCHFQPMAGVQSWQCRVGKDTHPLLKHAYKYQ